MTAPNAIDQNATSRMAELLTFEWVEVDVSTFEESTESARYAGFTSGITLGAEEFEAVPALSVGEIKIDGTLTPKNVNIMVPVGTYPFDEIAAGEPWSEIVCTIEEIDPDDTTTRRALWKGVVAGVVENPDGNEELLRIELRSPSLALDKALGIRAECHCAWALGDKNCCVDLGPLKNTITIASASADGFTITVTGLSPDAADRYWHRGHIRRGAGLITIRDYAVAGELVLARRIPDSWVGLSAMAVPGCDHTAGVCEARYNNIANFGGIGHAMLDYNPSVGFGG